MTLTVSVVTPSLGQGRFLPQCIDSVAAQTHRAIEHFVFDPGSTDDSRLLATAAPTVTLVAEPDRGQSDAVRSGFARSSGDIVAWLNADDWLADDTVLAAVVERFGRPDAPDIVYGNGNYVDVDGSIVEPAYVTQRPDRLSVSLTEGVGLLQPAVFIRRASLAKLDGGPDPALHYAMDYDLWVRAAKAGLTFVHLDKTLACATVHAEAKTQTNRSSSLGEAIDVAQRHYGYVAYSWARKLADQGVTGADGMFVTTLDDHPDSARIEEVTRRHLRRLNLNPAALAGLLRDIRHRGAQKTLLAMLGLRAGRRKR